MKPNLAKLFRKHVNPNTMQHFLNLIFTTVTSTRRPGVFFNFQFNCYDDDGRVRLVVLYGWSTEKGKWFFEGHK